MNIDAIKEYFLNLQNDICHFIEKEEGQTSFQQETWQHPHGGGGLSRIISGAVIEKGGVNFSHVYGNALPHAATQRYPQLTEAAFQALGVSVVMHPHNPYVPTSHFNVRCLIVTPVAQPPIWWFGGGFDLTPYYGSIEDCVHWHQMAKAACDPFGKDIYLEYKQWADRYFYLAHRNEPRGIGGIFFDDLNQWSFDRCFQFIRSVGKHYIHAYQPIIAKRHAMPYGDMERAFQHYRRGRYVEFNLLYDRGTLFGLQSKGYVKAILMSLPPIVTWPHALTAALQAQEQALLNDFLKPRDWVG